MYSASQFPGWRQSAAKASKPVANNAFDYLTAAVHSHLARQPAPTFYPGCERLHLKRSRH